MKTLVVTRWEKHEEPDGFCALQLGRLDVTLKEPPRGQGWQKVTVRVFPDFEYLSMEVW